MTARLGHVCRPLEADGPRPLVAVVSLLDGLTLAEKMLLTALVIDSYDGIDARPLLCCLRRWCGMERNKDLFVNARNGLREKGYLTWEGKGGRGQTIRYVFHLPGNVAVSPTPSEEEKVAVSPTPFEDLKVSEKVSVKVSVLPTTPLPLPREQQQLLLLTGRSDGRGSEDQSAVADFPVRGEREVRAESTFVNVEAICRSICDAEGMPDSEIEAFWCSVFGGLDPVQVNMWKVIAADPDVKTAREGPDKVATTREVLASRAAYDLCKWLEEQSERAERERSAAIEEVFDFGEVYRVRQGHHRPANDPTGQRYLERHDAWLADRRTFRAYVREVFRDWQPGDPVPVVDPLGVPILEEELRPVKDRLDGVEPVEGAEEVSS